ncbi:MAG: hypothetical protein EXR69_13555 [Myxococcales bacterium]|nr:hypothetical protein [Myxococcales bacterium]
MHTEPDVSVEAEVAMQLLEGLRAQLGGRVAQVKGVEVEVGEAHSLDPARVQVALTLLLPEVDVRVNVVAVLWKCSDCGAEFPADEHPCPVCGSVRVTMVRGDELGITRAWA